MVNWQWQFLIFFSIKYVVYASMQSAFKRIRDALQQQQQQLPNSSRLCGVWGDPDVHDLTPMYTIRDALLCSNP